MISRALDEIAHHLQVSLTSCWITFSSTCFGNQENFCACGWGGSGREICLLCLRGEIAYICCLSNLLLFMDFYNSRYGLYIVCSVLYFYLRSIFEDVDR